MKKFFSRAFLVMMVVLLYLPILVLAVYSFTDSANIGAIYGFSLKNYETLFTKPDLQAMIAGTLILAIGFYSGRFGNVTVGSLNQVPVVNAEVVTAFSLCILLIGVCGVDKSSFISLLIGHVVLEAPFVYLSVVPRLKQMDNSLYEAALDLGASPAMALRRVVFPQIFPGVVSGFALAVTLSLDDYFITSYTKPATFDTISTYVVNATRGSQTAIKTALWALSTIFFVVVILMVMIMNMNGNKNDKNQRRAGADSEKNR